MLRGKKPTPPALRLVIAGKRPKPTSSPDPGGAPTIPKWLVDPRARELFQEVAEQAYWLTALDAHLLAHWASAQADFEGGGAAWSVARRRELRSLAAELGMSPTSRSRLSAELPRFPRNDPSTKYFA